MLTEPDSLPVRLCLIITFIAIHGFFTAVNTAMVSSNRIIEKYQAAIRLVQVISCITGAWLSLFDWKTATVYVILFTVFAQYFPHKIGLQHDEGITNKLSGFIETLSTILRPITAILMLIANAFLKLFKQKTHVEDEAFSEEDVMSMLKVGRESGVLKEEGTKMINSIFAFDDKLAYEIMTPRTDVFLIDIEDSPEEYLDELMKLRYSRIPVCKGDSDNIIGILHIKDYLIKARETSFENVDIEGILRKAYFVPDTKNIDSLFFELQMSKQQIAVLIDEYGGFSGIVTMEDEYDEEEEIIDKIDDNTYLVDGDVDLDDLDEEIGIDLKSDTSETIGGFLIDILGEIPDERDMGRIIEFEDYKFKIMSVRERRIERVKIYMLDKKKIN